MGSTDVRALFLRVTPAEMRHIDIKAASQMRSRANWIALTVAGVIDGSKEAPSLFPEAAPADNSVVLFARVPVEFKEEVSRRAKEAGVPMSRWLRGVLCS